MVHEIYLFLSSIYLNYISYKAICWGEFPIKIRCNHQKGPLVFLWIVFVVWLTNERRLALFPAGTIVRDSHHRESPTSRMQGLNLYRT